MEAEIAEDMEPMTYEDQPLLTAVRLDDDISIDEYDDNPSCFRKYCIWDCCESCFMWFNICWIHICK